MIHQSACLFGITALSLFLVVATPLAAQPQSGCDSLNVAWRYYFAADFEKARSLIAACEEIRALELKAYIALKQDQASLAETLLCQILRQQPDYTPARKPVPPGFYDLAEKQRAKCVNAAVTNAADSTSPPPLIQPETNILGWMHCNVSYGRIWGDEDNETNLEYFPVLVHFRLGFQRAELEFRSIDVKNDVTQLPDPPGKERRLKDQLLLLAFKIQLAAEGAWRNRLPGVAVHFRTTVSDIFKWNTNAFDSTKYRRALEQLRIVATRSFKSFQFHAGADLALSLKNCVYPDTAYSPKLYCQEGAPGYKKAQPYTFYALAQGPIGPGIMFNAAYYSIPVYRFSNQPMKSFVQSLDVGIRVSPRRWLAFDFMANILLNSVDVSNPIKPTLNSQNDWRFRANATMAFSLEKFIPQPRVF